MRSDTDFVDQNASSDKAKAWNDSQSSGEMLRLLYGLAVKVAPRKLRLFGIECCLRIRGFTKDADCQRAIEYCEAMIEQSVADDELMDFRQQLDERRLRIINRLERSDVDEWAVAASMHLLQTDREYFTDTGTVSSNRVGSMAASAGVRTGRDLNSISDVRQNDLDNFAEIINGQAELLNEIVGNPFEAIQLETGWLTEQVVRLAKEHDRTPSRELMLELHDALQQTGCNDEKTLSHCLASHLHPRGCWLIDLLIGEPTFAAPLVEWDYTLSIDGAPDTSLQAIKARLRELASSDDGSLRQIERKDGAEFANFLAEHDFTSWAELVSCAAEIQEPTCAESYASAVSRYAMLYSCCRYRIELPQVYLKDRALWPRWWSEWHSNMDFGLPSAIDARPPSSGKLHLTPLLDAMSNAMRNLPVRDINFDGDYFAELLEILSSTAGNAITTFRSEIESNESGSSPFSELKESGLVCSLRRLVLKSWLENKAIRELADTSFKSLQELDFFEVCGVQCDEETLSYLMEQPWFQKLHSIRMNFRGSSCKVAMPLLSRLEQLTTLAIADSREEIFAHGCEPLTFPKLQRLYLGIDQIRSEMKGICNCSAPNLIEFWLSSNNTIGKNLIELINSELLSTISILRLNTPKLNSRVLDALLVAPFAGQIRVLELYAMNIGGPSEKSQKIFADANSMPHLCSLTLNGLFAKPHYSACAQWLRSLNYQSLRHLRLDDCKLDDSCLDAISGNPCFKHLESLEISEGYGQCHVTPEGAERFLQSLQCPNLRSLVFHRTNIGNRIECVAEPSCLPTLEFASFGDTLASPEVIERIKHVRPAFFVNR